MKKNIMTVSFSKAKYQMVYDCSLSFYKYKSRDNRSYPGVY
jgi:hypothetical protein